MNNHKKIADKIRQFFQKFKKPDEGASVPEVQLQEDLAVCFNKLLENQERLRVVNSITRQISSTMNITSLYKIIIEELLGILDINYCAICIYDEESKELNLHNIEEYVCINCDSYLHGFIQKCDTQLKKQNANSKEVLKLLKNKIGNNYLCVPLLNKDKFLGAIFVHNSSGPVNEENKQILTLVADNIAFAIENARLYSILEQKDQDKLEFIASMSHEFKNPLNTIIGFTNLLREGAINDPEKAIVYLDNISISSLHMSSLVVDIMDMAQAATNNIGLVYDEFTPKEIILEILSTQESAFEGKKINLKTSLNDFPIEADSKRFRQVIYNLVINAIKFTNDDGVIEIATYCDDKFFHFEIRDNGQGISAENQDKLFKFFSQANDDISKQKEGYGIGLAVCKKAIDLHQGEISFKSQRGEGTTFWFKLPMEKPVLVKIKK